jgi:hypothetical protein
MPGEHLELKIESICTSTRFLGCGFENSIIPSKAVVLWYNQKKVLGGRKPQAPREERNAARKKREEIYRISDFFGGDFLPYRKALEALQTGFFFHHIHAMFFHLGHQVVQSVPDVRFELGAGGLAEISPPGPLLQQGHLVAAKRGGIGSLQAGRAPVRHGDFSGVFRGTDSQGILKARGGVHGAVDGLAQVFAPVQAALVAADAGGDVLWVALHGLFCPGGIGRKGPAHADEVGFDAGKDLLSAVGLGDGAGGKDGDVYHFFNCLGGSDVVAAVQLHRGYLVDHLVMVSAADILLLC